MPQHSIQISRQSDDSQQASIMPQSMSQGQLQSSPISSPQQQQQASEVQTPQEACPRTILQRVRNSQNKHARMQWTQQSSVTGQRRASRGERRDTKYTCQPEPGKKLVQVTAQTISSPRLLLRMDCELDVQGLKLNSRRVTSRCRHWARKTIYGVCARLCMRVGLPL